MKNVACIIARTSSNRLKSKVLKDINGRRLIEYIIDKVKKARNVDSIYICTSTDQCDEVLCEIAEENQIKCYQGSLKAVIERMLAVGEIENADNLIRITGDNIFTDEVYMDLMLEHHIQNGCDYTRTEYLPIGVTSEIIKTKALQRCYEMINPEDSEYLMLYLFQPRVFDCQVLVPPMEHQHPKWALTIDTAEDLERMRAITANSSDVLSYLEVLNICRKYPPEEINMSPSEDVKFPGGIIITYSACRLELDNRIAMSNLVHITGDDFNNMFQKQNLEL